MGERRRTKAGHDGLGAELRRLRGGRTLGQISALSKAEPLAGRIKPIAAPTLSLIENGISMPNLETLYTLSIIYRTPMQRLWEIVGLERMAAATSVPETLDECKVAWQRACTSERWHDALAFSLRGEALSRTPADVLACQTARATALTNLGMAAEAISVLLEALASPDLPADRRYVVFHSLAGAHVDAGQPISAIVAVREALRTVPDSVPLKRRRALELGLAAALLTAAEQRFPEAERGLGEVFQLVQSARQSDLSPAERLQWDLFEALARRFEGNDAVAGKQLVAVAREAVTQDRKDLLVTAWHQLGAMRRAAGRLDDAQKALKRAESVADELAKPQYVFEVAVELLLLARARSDAASVRRFTRRCERHLPLVPRRSPSVILFEEAAAGGGEG